MGKHHKVFGNLKRPDGMSFEDFKKWWQEVHVPRVMKWAGLVAPMSALNFALNENEPFDGVGIAWFDNKESALRVFQTPERVSACRRLDCGRDRQYDGFFRHVPSNK
jgi:hypothetical protein